MQDNNSYFLETIFLLREEENVIIYSFKQDISTFEEQEVVAFLETEFDKEKLEFLDNNQVFDKNAALWAAKLLYFSLQFYLLRNDTQDYLKKLIQPFQGKKDVSTFLSADLSLRFILPLFDALKLADEDDPLVIQLEQILSDFHYSAIGMALDLENIDWETYFQNDSFKKLYLERIVERKDYKLAQIPYIQHLLMAELGLYKDIYWQEL